MNVDMTDEVLTDIRETINQIEDILRRDLRDIPKELKLPPYQIDSLKRDLQTKIAEESRIIENDIQFISKSFWTERTLSEIKVAMYPRTNLYKQEPPDEILRIDYLLYRPTRDYKLNPLRYEYRLISKLKPWQELV